FINILGGLSMKDKVVIVTGGSSGMGKAMVHRFANEGASVVMTGRNEERLQAAKQEIEKTATGIDYPSQMDVKNHEDVDRMVSETVEKLGRNDYLVNNAACNCIALAENLTSHGRNDGTYIVQY